MATWMLIVVFVETPYSMIGSGLASRVEGLGL